MKAPKSAVLPLAATGLALLLVAAVGFSLLRSDSDDKPVLRAVFTDASPLVEGNLVKIDGVKVGLISDISLREGKAVVEMEIDDSAPAIHEDVKATIRPKSLLGERYVEIDPGSDGKPTLTLPATLDAGQTKRSTDVQDVLDTLDDPTRAALSALVVTLGEGTDGQGKNIHDALAALAPAMDDTERLGKILASQNHVLASVVQRLAPVAESVTGKHGTELDRVVAGAEKTLSSVASKRQALNQALTRLPATLRTTRRTLSEVTKVGDESTKTLKGLRPVTDELPEITDELAAFTDSADPALASLPGVLTRIEGLVDEARPVVEALGPGVTSLRGISRDARTLVTQLQPRLSVILDAAKFWALSTNGMDGLGNYFRGVLAIEPQALLQIPGLSQPADGKDDLRPEGKDRGPSPLGIPGTNGLLEPDRDDDGESSGQGRTPSPGPSGSSDRGATGLDRKQEKNLVEMLLGGQG